MCFLQYISHVCHAYEAQSEPQFNTVCKEKKYFQIYLGIEENSNRT